MSQEEINDIKILIAQISGQIHNLSDMIKGMKESQDKDRDRASANGERITILEQQYKTINYDLQKNFDQHKDFYKIQDMSERLKGQISVWRFIAGGGGIIGLLSLVLRLIK